MPDHTDFSILSRISILRPEAFVRAFWCSVAKKSSQFSIHFVFLCCGGWRIFFFFFFFGREFFQTIFPRRSFRVVLISRDRLRSRLRVKSSTLAPEFSSRFSMSSDLDFDNIFWRFFLKLSFTLKMMSFFSRSELVG